MEFVFLMVWKMRQQVEFQKSRSTLQALISQKGAESEHITKAFEDLKDAFFPYDKNARSAELKKMREIMYSFLARGPLELTAMADPNAHKMQSRLARGQADLLKKETESLRGRLEKMDPMEKARRRARNSAS